MQRCRVNRQVYSGVALSETAKGGPPRAASSAAACKISKQKGGDRPQLLKGCLAAGSLVCSRHISSWTPAPPMTHHSVPADKMSGCAALLCNCRHVNIETSFRKTPEPTWQFLKAVNSAGGSPDRHQVRVSVKVTPLWSHIRGHTSVVTLAWSHLCGHGCGVTPGR